MKVPKRVKFVGYKSKNPLYASGLRRNKIYETIEWDMDFVLDIYKDNGTVTVNDDDGVGHEIEKVDYEVKEWTTLNLKKQTAE